MRHHFTVTVREQGIIWLGGGIRGAVAFALILSVHSSGADTLITTTLGLCAFTTVVFGAVMPLWCWLLTPKAEGGVTEGSLYIPRSELLTKLMGDEAAPTNDEYSLITHPNQRILVTRNEARGQKGWLHRKWREFDDNVLKPCLLKKSAIR
jgi:hypothetical protein